MIKLYPYQILVLDWLRNRKECALFLEQRLGKTYITIADILNKPIYDKILIIAPYSAWLAWEYTLKEFNQYSIQFIEGTRKQRINSLHNLQKWNITNYQTSIKSELLSVKWNCVVLDESTYIKNPKAKMTKYFLRLGDNTEYKYILSGTPGLENPLDYFCQLRFLSREWLGKNYWEFRNKYCFLNGYNWVLTNSGKEILRQTLQNNTYNLKRKDVGFNSNKIYKIITIGKTKEFERIEKTLLEKYLLMRDGKLLDSTVWITTMLIWYRQLTGGFIKNNMIDNLKSEEIYKIINENKDKKIIIWAVLLPEINFFYDRGIEKIDGSVKPEKRIEIAERFNNGGLQYIVCNPEATKFGINLSAADISIFYSMSFSLTTQLQAEDRMVKQNKESIIYKLIRKNTIDQDILNCHSRKLTLNQTMEIMKKKYEFKN